MKKYFEVLRRCPLFDGIADGDLLGMMGCLGGRVDFFDKKYTIFAEGSPAKYIGVVLSGSAQIMQVDYYGNRSILSNVTPGEVFAEAFACVEIESLPVTVIANEPSEILFLECHRILHTCSKHCSFHQQLIFNLMKDLASKTLVFHQKIEVVSKRTTREKLMTYLMLQAKKANSPSFDIPFDRQELADYLEVDRSGLSSEIGKLCKEGVIKARKFHFELL